MPVSRAARVAVMASLGLWVALPATAARVVTVRMLTASPAVTHAYETFETASKAIIFYNECRADLGITDEEFEYMQALYQDSGRRVAKAYAEGYMQYVGHTPQKEFVDEYVAAISARQQAASTEAARLVRADGCRHPSVIKMHEFIQRYQATNPREALTYAPRLPVQETPKPVEQPQPAAINETQPAAR